MGRCASAGAGLRLNASTDGPLLVGGRAWSCLGLNSSASNNEWVGTPGISRAGHTRLLALGRARWGMR